MTNDKDRLDVKNDVLREKKKQLKMLKALDALLRMYICAAEDTPYKQTVT